jgi:hypothetical protein
MTPSDRDHPVNRPEFQAAVRGTLVKRGVKQHELEEEWLAVRTATVEFLILEKRQIAPDAKQDLTQGRVNALGCGIASNRAIKKGEKLQAQRKREEERKGEPLSHAAVPERTGEDAMIAGLDQRKAIQAIGAMLEKGEITEQQLDALDRKGTGDKRGQIAEDLGTDGKKLDNDARAARKRIHKVLAVVVPGFAFGMGLWVWLPSALEASKLNTHQVAIRADVAGPVHELAEVKAAEMRKDALAKCAKKDWDGCEQELHATYDMDPVGYLDPAVQNALWAIVDAHNEQMKSYQVKAPSVPVPKKPQAPKGQP